MDQPGKVANPARGQLNRENNIPLSPCVPENLVSRDGFSRPVPRQPAHLHTQAESGAYLRDSSRVARRRPFMKPPYAIGSVPSLSGHAIAYRWRSLPRVRRHRASKPQGSSERVLPWQITMDQLIFASLSHTHVCGSEQHFTHRYCGSCRSLENRTRECEERRGTCCPFVKQWTNGVNRSSTTKRRLFWGSKGRSRLFSTYAPVSDCFLQQVWDDPEPRRSVGVGSKNG